MSEYGFSFKILFYLTIFVLATAAAGMPGQAISQGHVPDRQLHTATTAKHTGQRQITHRLQNQNAAQAPDARADAHAKSPRDRPHDTSAPMASLGPSEEKTTPNTLADSAKDVGGWCSDCGP